MKAKIIGIFIFSMIILTGCGREEYEYSDMEATSGKIIKEYKHKKNNLKLDHSVEYDERSEKYNILIFSYGEGFTEQLILGATKGFVEKHFPEELRSE